MRTAIVGGIRLYQLTLSGLFFRGVCRHLPTCSEYAIEAVSKHGALLGSWMAARRIGRCRPMGTAGYDPVP